MPFEGDSVAATREPVVAKIHGSLSVIWDLARHELAYQRKETFLGLIWTMVWPLVQAGGFLLAFNLIRGHGAITPVRTYLGVLVWSSSAMLFTYSLGFFTRNGEMVRHLAFPLHLILINEINVRYLFFLVQYLIASSLLAISAPPESFSLWLLAQVIFVIALYGLLLASCWIASLLGALLPDLGVLLPPCFTLLLALSPLFQPMESASAFLQFLKAWNPLSFRVEKALASPGGPTKISVPWNLLATALVMLGGMKLLLKHFYRELARLL